MTTEQIKYKSKILALIIYRGEMPQGLKFFTPDDYSLQMGKHYHSKGTTIKAHKHCAVKIKRHEPLQEVLFIEEGKVKIDFYSDDGRPLESKILKKGDIVLLREGGHSFEFLEITKMWEIKQGPYDPLSRQHLPEKDKA